MLTVQCQRGHKPFTVSWKLFSAFIPIHMLPLNLFLALEPLHTFKRIVHFFICTPSHTNALQEASQLSDTVVQYIYWRNSNHPTFLSSCKLTFRSSRTVKMHKYLPLAFYSSIRTESSHMLQSQALPFRALFARLWGTSPILDISLIPLALIQYCVKFFQYIPRLL